MDEGGVTRRQGDRDPGGKHGPLPRRQLDVDGRHQIGSGVTGMGICRQRQLRIQPLDADLQAHGRKRYSPAGPKPSLHGRNRRVRGNRSVGTLLLAADSASGPSGKKEARHG